MITLADLNANQKRAVDWDNGPLLVLAGPGSGKTVVLTLRVVRLLEENADASALALTFTNKAAAEMRDRVDRSLAQVAANRLDFGSLLHFANRLLREKPAVARVVRLGWTHICVDEFQDTNRAQYDLLRLIAPSRRHNLFVVADDDQIIYQWNGASPRRFDDLRNDYELETVQLPESYRCPPEIVEHANRLIGHNTRLVTTRKTVSVREAVAPVRGNGSAGGCWQPNRGSRVRGTRHSRARAGSSRLCCARAYQPIGPTGRRCAPARGSSSSRAPKKGRIRLPRSRCSGGGAEAGQFPA